MFRIRTWKEVAAVLDTVSANAIAQRLELEGVRAVVQSDTSLLGAARQCRVLVQPDDVERARRILSPFTDEELSRLALGEPDKDA
jgi:hypothetical protein